MFSIQTTSGKDIGAHSYFDNEDEILLPPGLYFKVIGCLNPAEDLHIIQIREIQPPYPMLAEPFDLTQMKKELPTEPSTKEDNYSTPSVTPKPSTKEHNYSTPSVTPKPSTKEDNYSTPSVTQKPSVQPAPGKGKHIVFSCI
jgi:hypothetical protein